MPSGDGGFKKGHKKIGGRVKGTPNKPKPYAIFLQEFMEEDKEKFREDFKNLKPKERCEVRASIFKYVAPALSSVDVNANVSEETAMDRIKKMSEED